MPTLSTLLLFSVAVPGLLLSPGPDIAMVVQAGVLPGLALHLLLLQCPLPA